MISVGLTRYLQVRALQSMESHETIQQAKIFREMCEALPVAVSLTDCDGNILYANKALSCRCEIDLSDLTNHSIGYLFRTAHHGHESERKYANDFREQATGRHRDPLL